MALYWLIVFVLAGGDGESWVFRVSKSRTRFWRGQKTSRFRESMGRCGRHLRCLVGTKSKLRPTSHADRCENTAFSSVFSLEDTWFGRARTSYVCDDLTNHGRFEECLGTRLQQSLSSQQIQKSADNTCERSGAYLYGYRGISTGPACVQCGWAYLSGNIEHTSLNKRTRPCFCYSTQCAPSFFVRTG